MMGIDQARAGDGGVVSTYQQKKEEEEKKKAEGPDLFQSKESSLKVKVPDGWKVGKG